MVIEMKLWEGEQEERDSKRENTEDDDAGSIGACTA